MSKTNNSPEVYWLKRIHEMLRTVASSISGSGGYSIIASFTVDDVGAPEDGDTQYLDPNMANLTSVAIVKNGVGYLELTTDYTLVEAGGFDLASGEFTTGERYTIWGK